MVYAVAGEERDLALFHQHNPHLVTNLLQKLSVRLHVC